MTSFCFQVAIKTDDATGDGQRYTFTFAKARLTIQLSLLRATYLPPRIARAS